MEISGMQLRVNSRNGTPLVLYNFAAGGEHPIHGAYFDGENWNIISWAIDGSFKEGQESPLDILYDSAILEKILT